MAGRIEARGSQLSVTLDDPQAGEPRTPAAEARFYIGRFLIVGRLGEGAMGEVFSAYDPDLDRKVAVKFVRSLPGDPFQAVARVRQEAQALAKVSHPNVVQVFEVGESNGRIFIVMEIVDGGSLAQLQEEGGPVGPREIDRRLRLYLQAAAGLLAAHRCGLIHRDFKPDNVLLGRDGRVRVADFGLARVIAGISAVAAPSPAPPSQNSQGRSGQRLTQVGAVLGTAGYISPEQIRGAEADERSDQFSFCASLYEALYGQQPFPGQSFEQYAMSILDGHLNPPPTSHVPLIVQQAILRGLSQDPAARFPSMQELIGELEAGLCPDSEPLITRADRVRIGLTLASVLIVVVLINGAAAVMLKSRDSLLRGLVFQVVLLCAASILMRWPPWLVRHPQRYRRMMGFFLIVLGTGFFWRLTGLLTSFKVDDYYTLEVIGLAGLFAVEGLRVGWRHCMLALPALAYAPFIRLWPELRVVLYNLLLVGMVITSILIHMHQAVAEPSASGRAR